MSEMRHSDVVTLAGPATAFVRVEGDQPQPLSMLSEEITAQIGDIERHLDTERDEWRRYQLIDTMHSLMWARENLVCMMDRSRAWTAPPRTTDLSARYPHPDQQPA